MHLEIKGVTFEWDDNKAASNLSKHGVTFEQASDVFFDPFFRLMPADRNEEARHAALGYAGQSLLYVVHVEVSDEGIRIISARKAMPNERKAYEQDS